MTLPVNPNQIGPVLLAETQIPARAGAVSVMSHVQRAGEWVLPRLFRTVAFMGPVDVDLTRVRLGSGVSAPDAPLVRVQGLSLMSNVKVKVVDPNNPTSWLDRLRGRRADRP